MLTAITTRGGTIAQLWAVGAAVDSERYASSPPTTLPGMTTDLEHTDREQQALRIYDDAPLEHGDVVLLLDETFCLELEGLADDWDERGRRHLVEVVRRSAQRVVVAVARDRARLLPKDHQLWRDLQDDLRDSEVELPPLRALRAA